MNQSPRAQTEVTRMLANWREGDREAPAHLVELVYEELRAIAGQYLQRERAGHTLQATALVHEAYVRLVDQTTATWQNRAHFMGVAAQVMRRVLVDHARKHRAEKRGGTQETLVLDETADIAPQQSVDLLALDDALGDLAALDSRQSQIVELRFFGGLTNDEIAEMLDLSTRTIKREWRLAKAWLRREIFGDEQVT